MSSATALKPESPSSESRPFRVGDIVAFPDSPHRGEAITNIRRADEMYPRELETKSWIVPASQVILVEAARTFDSLSGNSFNPVGADSSYGTITLGGEEFYTERPYSEFDARVAEVFMEAEKLLISKHKDYGPGNIALAPGGPLNGLRVRIFDKTARIDHLLDTGAEPQNESLRDSFLDLANYAIIALLVLDGDWPTP